MADVDGEWPQPIPTLHLTGRRQHVTYGDEDILRLGINNRYAGQLPTSFAHGNYAGFSHLAPTSPKNANMKTVSGKPTGPLGYGTPISSPRWRNKET